MEEFKFFLEVLVAGLLSGVMYSLVALGFVLIYKTSGVFNFAQGAQLLFAALTFVCLNERGIPMWGAFVISLAIMVFVGILIERVRVASLGCSNANDLVHGDHRLGLHHRRGRAACMGRRRSTVSILVSTTYRWTCGACLSADFDLVAAAVAAAMVGLLTVFFNYTRIGTGIPGRGAGSARVVGRRAALGSHQGRGLGGVRAYRSCRRTFMGRAARRSVLAVPGGAEGSSGSRAGWFQFDRRRDRRRPHYRCGGEAR